MLRTLNAAGARRWADLVLAGLIAERDAIDRINLYPVADSDTGTNLLATMRSAVAALDAAEPETVGGVIAALARGARDGACGNSGILLSQAVRGVAEGCGQAASIDGAVFAQSLRSAHEHAAAAVADPVPGTLLTVLEAAAQAVPGGAPLPEAVHEATRAAAEALQATTGQLPVLREAGVVDAGGRGLVLLLDALHAVVHDGKRVAPDAPTAPGAASSGLQHESAFDYEVMYLLNGPGEQAAAELRDRLAGLGDCVSVVGEQDSWLVHVHCADIGAAVEAGIAAGHVHRIKVTRFADQRAGLNRDVAVLACVPDAQTGELFAAEGADVLRADADLSPAGLVEAVRSTGAEHVVVLTNDGRTAALAERAVFGADQDVVVLPTASPVQGMSALAVHDPGRRRADDQVAMAEAAAATRRGELRVADAEALTWVGRCVPGDVLGLVDDEVVLIAADLPRGARELVDRMLANGGELLTALVPEESTGELLAEHLRRTRPEVELACYPAGCSGSVLLLGVE
ncbi:DAK2 domain-containing protein [Saccharopolyspora montiporae]|uniref:DAK2 domain-containing protein n=1 Tax=Saccharopolyspora montiporae TaxID=2781240 RepID=UPI00351C3A82